MSCYSSFFYGDFTGQEDLDWNKMPCLLSVSVRSEYGKCFDIFPFDKPTLVTSEDVKRINDKLTDCITELNKSKAACIELRNAVLSNINNGDFEENTYHVAQLNDELTGYDEDILYISRLQGSLFVIDNLIGDKFPITALIG